MKYFVDLDDTLINSTNLNNDAYNFALEKYGYSRIVTSERLTREKFKFVDELKLDKIIELKQLYFCQDWLKYRITLNELIIKKLEIYKKSNCFLWTKANKTRVLKILEECKLDRYFKEVIFDKKISFEESITKLKNYVNSKQIVIYENNRDFFVSKNYKIIDVIKNQKFDVRGYLVW